MPVSEVNLGISPFRYHRAVSGSEESGSSGKVEGLEIGHFGRVRRDRRARPRTAQRAVPTQIKLNQTFEFPALNLKGDEGLLPKLSR
jgi:hypothetical protein